MISRPWNLVLLTVIAVIVCFTRLNTNPPLFWDEGWTLSATKNWLQLGKYGQLVDGRVSSPGLAASPTVAIPILISFRALGVGIWQGRLPGVLFTLGLLYVLWRLG